MTASNSEARKRHEENERTRGSATIDHHPGRAVVIVLRLLVAAVAVAALIAFVMHGMAGHPVEPAPITIETSEPVPYQGEQP